MPAWIPAEIRAWMDAWRRRARVFSLAFASGAVPMAPVGAARADTPPSAWDEARDPGTRERWDLHVRVERLLHPTVTEGASPVEGLHEQELRLEAARDVLEQNDALHSPDVRLTFDLGVVYEQLAGVQKRNDLHRKAIAILAPALEAHPHPPGAVRALDALVFAYAKLDMPQEELAAWRRYVSQLLDDRARIGPLMNMGEAEMRVGLLDEAIATFREGLRLCGTLPNSNAVNETFSLTLWDLAVALDRSGDPSAAIRTAGKAKGWTWSEVVGQGAGTTIRVTTGWDIIRDDAEVFFVPEWEREWYLALGTAAEASSQPDGSAVDPRDAARWWGEAEHHWEAYETQAVAAGGTDRWLPIARARLNHARKVRAQAEARASKVPPRRLDDEKDDHP